MTHPATISQPIAQSGDPDANAARGCQLAGLAHGARTFGFWARLIVAGLCGWTVRRRMQQTQQD